MSKMLGKRPPRVDSRTLLLAKYIKALQPAPAQVYYQQKVSEWGMLLNDTYGDCVPAAAGHMILQWSTYAGKPYRPTDDQILTAYEQIGGYVPGDPTTDNGCDMLTALNTWRKSGIAGHKIAAFASSKSSVRESVQLFGNCYIGLALPLSAQPQTGWFIDDSVPENAVPGSWGGHCVEIVGYNPRSLTVVTWGSLLNMSWNFFSRYCDEAYSVVSQDWIETNGLAPSGFDLKQLLADLSEVTA